MSVAQMRPAQPSRVRWQPMRIRYVGQIGDIMRGAAGTRRDLNNNNCVGNANSGSQCT